MNSLFLSTFFFRFLICLFLYLIDLRDLFLCYLVYLFLHYILLFVYRPSVDLVKFKLTAEQTVMELNPMNMLVAQKLKSLRSGKTRLLSPLVI